MSSGDEWSDQDLLLDEFDELTIEDRPKKLTKADFRQKIEENVLSLHKTTRLSPGLALLLLSEFHFNITVVSSMWFDDPKKLLNRVGLTEEDIQKLSVVTKRTINECPICCDRKTSGIALGCHHYVCHQCYRLIMEDQMALRRIFRITCFGNAECQLPVTLDAVSSDLKEKFWEIATDLYIMSLPDFHQCPECELVTQGSVCANGHSFCSDCGETPHLSLPCDFAKEWLQLVDSEHRSGDWILRNTKRCPKCHAQIEKAEGCNHMICYRCQNQFCWMCGLEWDQHTGSTFNCVRYVPASDQSQKEGKRWKSRVRYYSLRYDTHAHQEGLVPKAHQVLAWSFAFLCFCDQCNNRLILEDNVNDLEQATEKLIFHHASGQPSTPLIAYVKRRTASLEQFISESKWPLKKRF